MRTKIVLIFVGVISTVAFAFADSNVRGYIRRDGTYVKPYTRSSPNNSRSDNYGSERRRSSSDGYSSPYTRDSDGDGISNQFDYDDDNDGVSDENESRSGWK